MNNSDHVVSISIPAYQWQRIKEALGVPGLENRDIDLRFKSVALAAVLEHVDMIEAKRTESMAQSHLPSWAREQEKKTSKLQSEGHFFSDLPTSPDVSMHHKWGQETERVQEVYAMQQIKDAGNEALMSFLDGTADNWGLPIEGTVEDYEPLTECNHGAYLHKTTGRIISTKGYYSIIRKEPLQEDKNKWDEAVAARLERMNKRKLEISSSYGKTLDDKTLVCDLSPERTPDENA